MPKVLCLFVVLCVGAAVVLGQNEEVWKKFEEILQKCAEEQGHDKELPQKLAAIVKEGMADGKPSPEAQKEIEDKCKELFGDEAKHQEFGRCMEEKLKA